MMNMKYVLCLVCLVYFGTIVDSVPGKGLAAQFTQMETEVASLEGTFQELQTKSSVVVAFSAHGLSDEYTLAPTGMTVPYQNVSLNEGSGYDINTAIFTAPVGGLYLFTAHFCNAGYYYAVIRIVHNGEISAFSSVGDTYGSCTSLSKLIRVGQGDSVSVESNYAVTNFWETIHRQNSFQGYFIHE